MLTFSKGGRPAKQAGSVAEVARECAVPTYHIETEADLDRTLMVRYSCVGVSAGASTPNWIIRDVVHRLESIKPEGKAELPFRKILELLTYSNTYVALGAALLPFAVQALTGLEGAPSDGAMAAFYVFAMHSLNIYLDRNAIRLNDPSRAAFYHRWRTVFTSVSIAAVVGALAISMRLGLLTFFALGILVLLGILYAVPVILPSWWQSLSVLKIKDIPTSKTFSVPVAWATVTVVLPYLSEFPDAFGRLAYAFWIIFLLVLIRTTLLDLLAVQGDRLVGKETLVVLVGEDRTSFFIIGMLGILALSLILGPLAGLSSPFALLLLPAVAADAWHLRMCFKNRLKEDPVFETQIESVIMGSGLLALLWSFFA